MATNFMFGREDQQREEEEQHRASQQQHHHPLGSINYGLAEEAERESKERERQQQQQREQSSPGSNPNESPPTSPPQSEAPPPSDDEFTNFVLRRAARQLGVDFIPGSSRQASPPNNQNQQQQQQQRGGGNNNNPNARTGSVVSHHSTTTTGGGGAGNHVHHHSTSGAAHPIDTLKSHHWQDQIAVDEVSELPVPRFPSTLKAARRVANVEKRLQEPPPPGLQRFGQFSDCSPQEIARMIELRETSLGDTHASVPPLYDVLGDMLLFEGEVAQAERNYTTCLSRLEQRSSEMKQDEVNKTHTGKFSRFHPSNKSNPNSWLQQATNWSQEVACIHAKLAMLWLQQGKKEAACSAFMKAAELADPSGVMMEQGFGSNNRTSTSLGRGTNRGRGSSPNPSNGNATVPSTTNNNEKQSAFTKYQTQRFESPEASHLRQLLIGLGPAPENNYNKHRSDSTTSNNINNSSAADRSSAIANALAEKLLMSGAAGHKSPTRNIDVQTVLSSTAAGAGNRADSEQQPNAMLDEDDYRQVSTAPTHHQGGGGSKRNSRSGSMQQNQPPMHPSSMSMTQPTPLRYGRSQSQPNSNNNNMTPNLHDASSLKNLVDSIAHDGRAEDSRRRMRSQLNQMHNSGGGNPASLSPQRVGNYHSIGQHSGSGQQGPSQAETNETLRKTKDLQDIISRIRGRSDLMP